MNVYGVEITEEQQQSCLDAMHAQGTFSAKDIEQAAIKSGIPRCIDDVYSFNSLVAHRVVDKLIQQQRKAGIIYLKGKDWVVRPSLSSKLTK